MKVFKNMATLVAMVCLCSNSFSQTLVGIKAGVYSLNNDNTLTGDLAFETIPKLGYHAGITLDIGVTKEFSVTTGVSYASKGWSNDVEAEFGEQAEGYSRDRLGYIEVPLHFTTKPGRYFQFFVGPYVAFGIHGKHFSNFTTDEVDVEFDFDLKPAYEEVNILTGDGGDFRGIDAGLDVGFNLGLSDRTFFNVAYSQGYGNVLPPVGGDFYGNSKITYRNLSFSLTVFINKKKVTNSVE